MWEPQLDKGLNQGAKFERRKKPRISTPFPITVHGINEKGERYQFETLIDNLSVGGVYLRHGERIDPYSKLELFIQLSESAGKSAPVIKAEGIVLRTELKTDGLFGLAVVFTNHRFIQNKVS